MTRFPAVLLLDADGTLFPSEEPAFDASARVTADLAARFGIPGDFSPGRLRRMSTGTNFRTAAGALLDTHGKVVDPAEFERWVERERIEVTEHLTWVLRPCDEVTAAVTALAERSRLAVVTSSASARLDACLTACGLGTLLPADVRFSAEDLPVPTSKPDPAVYLHALDRLGVDADDALAVEDSVVGVRSAVAAGVTAVGITQLVPADERAERTPELLRAGAAWVAGSWDDLARRLSGSAAPALR